MFGIFTLQPLETAIHSASSITSLACRGGAGPPAPAGAGAGAGPAAPSRRARGPPAPATAPAPKPKRPGRWPRLRRPPPAAAAAAPPPPPPPPPGVSTLAREGRAEAARGGAAAA